MKRLEVVIESNLCAFVKGYGSRELLTDLRGRPPIWSSVSRAWVTTAEVAANAVAVAESRGWQVVVEETTSTHDDVSQEPDRDVSQEPDRDLLQGDLW